MARGKARHHEAGHVVAAHFLGVKTKFVYIGSKEEGQEENCLTSYDPKTYSLEGVEAAAICLAGGIAENRHAAENGKPEASLVATSGDDLQTLMYLALFSESEQEFYENVDKAEALAEKLINDNWELVKEVADLFSVGKKTENPMEKVNGN